MTKANKNTRKKIIISILILMVVAVAGFIAYDRISYSVEKQKFIQLRKDMRSLQKEFNKIDSGWEYKEWCSSTREKLNPNQAAYCSASLSNKTIVSVDRYNKAYDFFKISKASERSDKEQTHIFSDVEYKETFSCGMNTNKNTSEYFNSNLRCSSESRNSHFHLAR